MTNGEPAYSVIVTHAENKTCIQGYAYMKMNAKEYINSIPITYEQYCDPAVEPDEIPDHFLKTSNKKKNGKESGGAKRRRKLLKTIREEQGR